MYLKHKIFVKTYFKKAINAQEYENVFNFHFFLIFFVFTEFFKDFFHKYYTF